MYLFRKIRYLDDAAQNIVEGEVLVKDGVIADLGQNLGTPDGATVIEAEGAVLSPGLVDIRASLGEPGFEYRETIASAAEAAAAGGITTIAVLPDSKPAIDDPGTGAADPLARRGNRLRDPPALRRRHARLPRRGAGGIRPAEGGRGDRLYRWRQNHRPRRA